MVSRADASARWRSDDGPRGSSPGHQLEEETKKGLGLETDFLVRTAAELDDAIARKPFPEEAERDPAHLVVMFLKSTPAAAAVKALQAAITGRGRRLQNEARCDAILNIDSRPQ